MGNDFFALEFSSFEREVLTRIQGARNLGDLINRVTMTDLETVQAIDHLAGDGRAASSTNPRIGFTW